ncbi:MAG: penicillin-binding protein 2 [Candidatus Aerophobetes bacterium]|nr:penicillin-binding protein 2 [Candidatus Aerophobetes bacterium]
MVWRKQTSEKGDRFEGRINILLIGIICGFLFLLGRVAYLQLWGGERYFHLSQNSRLQLIPLPPSRGLILDRKGKILAENKVSFALDLIPSNVKDVSCLLGRLTKVLPLNKEMAINRLKKASNPFRPVCLKKGINISELTLLLEKEEEFPGTVITAYPMRFYPHKKLASHLIGHLGEVSGEELLRNSPGDIEQGDFVGKMGIEKVYNEYLQGKKGGRQIEVDAYGHSLRTISERDPLPGDNIYLTIDLKMQKIAEEELGKHSGSVIIGNPWTGEIFTLASYPAFDPNLFSCSIPEEEWDKLSCDPKHPLQNRAVRGEYSAASTFKIIVTAAALENKVIKKEESILCRGSLRIGNRVFKDWKAHGKVNLKKALVQSCDVFFYQLGLKTGIEKIIRFAHLFGLGESTGIDLPGESRGLLPTPSWKLKNKGEKWWRGDTANLSIGQGYILVTPIQMFRVASAVANGGKVIKPYLVKKIVDTKGRVIKEFSGREIKKIPLSSSTLRFLRESLREVVAEGTGWKAKNRVVEISGKTGTVQLQEGENPHSWFIGYAPSKNSSLAIVVIMEHIEEEEESASEITGRILSRIFKKED